VALVLEKIQCGDVCAAAASARARGRQSAHEQRLICTNCVSDAAGIQVDWGTISLGLAPIRDFSQPTRLRLTGTT
jgi:hypothetical protein